MIKYRTFFIMGLTIIFLAAGIIFTLYTVKNIYKEPGHEVADNEYTYRNDDKVNIVDNEINDEFVKADNKTKDKNVKVDKEANDEFTNKAINKSLTSDITKKDESGTVVIEMTPKDERQDENESSIEDDKRLPEEEVSHDRLNQESIDSKTHGKSLDKNKLAGLSNKKYGWWVRYKAEYQAPVISSSTKKLIDKYDGIFLGNTDEKVIYLTFDEGYENGYTPKILDTLKENDVKAVFFITGSYMKRNKDLVRRMLDEGHLVGGHTINHPSLPDVDDSVLENELYGFEKEYNSIFNEKIKYIRPPNGEFSERTLAATQLMGYKSTFWSLTYRDFETDKQKGADYAYKMVMDKLHNGAVILLHAVSSDNAEALDRILKDIKAQGYEFRLLDF